MGAAAVPYFAAMSQPSRSPSAFPDTPEAAAEAAGLRLERDPGAAALGMGRAAVDSRRPLAGNAAKDTVFVALRGPRHDGHDHLAEAFARGARIFLAQRRVPLPGPATWLLVPQDEPVLDAFQRLAAARRAAFAGPVLGITGSGGKTIVKEWLAALLGPERRVHRNPRSYNSQVGVPLSVWGLEAHHELGLFEAGISLPGEMARLRRVLQPTAGLFTGLGAAHDEGFPDRAAKLAEKLDLFEGCGTLLYRADDPAVAPALRERFPAAEHVTWSLDPAVPATRQATLDDAAPGRPARLRIRGPEGTVDLPLPHDDPFTPVNLLHAACAALWLGAAPEALAARAATLSLPDMRLQVLSGQRGGVVVNDAWACDPASLGIALAFTARQAGPGLGRTAVLSDIEQSGLDEETLYAGVAGELAACGFDRLVAVGPAMTRAVARGAFGPAVRAEAFPDTAALLDALPDRDFGRQAILVKGARRFGLERVAERLGAKHHGTRLEIDLDALAHNVHAYRAALGPGPRLAVMVKALGYGTGDAEVARVLAYQRVDLLGVAYPDEGVALRQAGVETRVLVLNAAPETWRVCARFGLEPVLHAVEDLRALRAAHPDLPVHAQLETGMHRLGLTAEDLAAAAADAPLLSGLRLASVFSHLAAAEDPAHDAFTREQIRRFTEGADALIGAWTALNPGAEPPWRHLANSAGALRFPEARLDLVRLGIGVYGHDPSGRMDGRLRPVARLVTTVSQVRTVAAGESVGYGRAARLDRPTRVATLAVGYADGFRRSLGRGVGSVVARGRELPVLGNVCMDMIMVDAGACPDLRPGDDAEVFGPRLPLDTVARRMGTIPYEVLTGVSSRVQRVYWSA